MSHTITTPDGKNHLIRDSNDFYNLLYRYIGYDAANCFDDILAETRAAFEQEEWVQDYIDLNHEYSVMRQRCREDLQEIRAQHLRMYNAIVLTKEEQAKGKERDFVTFSNAIGIVGNIISRELDKLGEE